jgi:hypothetical protein
MTKFQLDQANVVNQQLMELRSQKEEWNKRLNVDQQSRMISINYLAPDEMLIHVNKAREAFNKSIDSKIEGLEQAFSMI